MLPGMNGKALAGELAPTEKAKLEKQKAEGDSTEAARRPCINAPAAVNTTTGMWVVQQKKNAAQLAITVTGVPNV